MTGAPALLFADLESDGLGPGARLLEIGLRVTDSDLATIAEESWILPYRPVDMARIRDDAIPLVRDMHDASGLWTECADAWGRVDWQEARGDCHRQVRDDVHAWVEGHARSLPIAGSSCRVDRDWLTGWIPELDGLLHYRMGDVSALKVLLTPWIPADRLASKPVPAKRHRVMPDLDDTIEEALWYRTVLGLDVVA